MAQTIRISLFNTDALEASPDARDYILLADEDNVLIKEHSRGTAQVNDGADGTATHNLGYTPHCYAYGETSTNGRFQLITGFNPFIGWRMHVTDTTLVMRNATGTNDREVRFFIFYDNIE